MSDVPWTPVLVGLVMALVFGGTGGLVLALWRRRTKTAHDIKLASVATTEPARDPFVYGSLQDKRLALRRRGGSVDVLVSDADLETPPVRGTVVDRSVGGMRLLVEQPFEVGTRLSVRAAHAPEAIVWVRVEVKNRLDGDDCCEIGCKFAQTPPTSVLWLFG